TAVYNTEKHRMSIRSTSPSVISSASSSPSEATTTSGGSSGSNSTIAQGFVASRNPNRSGRSLDDHGRDPDSDITPRQREFPPVENDPPNVFSFMNDASEVASSYQSDSSAV